MELYGTQHSEHLVRIMRFLSTRDMRLYKQRMCCTSGVSYTAHINYRPNHWQAAITSK
jgi:hypothetical protein